MTKQGQRGFATFEVILVVIVLVAITGFAAWRIIGNKQDDTQKNLVSGPLTSEDRQRLEETTAESTEAQTTTTASGGNAASTPTSSGQATTNNAKKTTTNSTPAPTTQNTSPQPTTTPPSAPAPSNRPTAEFCQQKNGASFTNAWAIDNSSHTYQVWENGGWVNKTETGTAARNFDTMQIVGVIPYLKQAAWAICSEKAGYITFYYRPTGSVYTYNWLVAYEHISIVQP